ncbi:MAG: zinc-ribbon domain-containing protein, partial [Clostridia bacterium]|nr:zinc-ribbon domain-containing protein [Clostridia bacterium]
ASNTGNFCTSCGAKKPAPATDWTCTCGTVNNGNFCTNCGTKKPSAPTTKTCSNCGKTHPDTTKFCPDCGNQL